MNIVKFYQEQGVNSEKTARFLANHTRVVKRKKGYRLLTAGDEPTTILILLDGVLSFSYIDDNGRESVMGFRLGTESCSVTLNLEDTVELNVQAVTAVTLLVLPKTALNQALQMDSSICEAIIHQMAENQKNNYSWQIVMRAKDSVEKYRWFLEEYGYLVDVIPQKDIANFLNITPQTHDGLDERRTISENRDPKEPFSAPSFLLCESAIIWYYEEEEQ